jgi:lysophospholipase L1-like esterase
MPSCGWYRQQPNGDILWSRRSNGSCSPAFELDLSDRSLRYTRQATRCQYVDDENPRIILSNSSFERQLLRFDRALIDAQKPSVVFYGSSSIRLWTTLADDFSNLSLSVINRGFGGSTMKQCWEQFKRTVLPLEPRLLMIYAGENDLAEDQTPSSIRTIFRQMIVTIRRFFPSLPVSYISIKPSPSRLEKINEMNTTNHLIQQEIRSMPNVYYIDVFHAMLTPQGIPRPEIFAADDLHMNEEGYAIWTRAVYQSLYANGLISNGGISSELSLVIAFVSLLGLYFG